MIMKGKEGSKSAELKCSKDSLRTLFFSFTLMSRTSLASMMTGSSLMSGESQAGWSCSKKHHHKVVGDTTKADVQGERKWWNVCPHWSWS